MSRADRYERLAPDAAARWDKFGTSETIFYPVLLGLEVEETRVDYCRMRLAFKTELLHRFILAELKREPTRMPRISGA